MAFFDFAFLSGMMGSIEPQLIFSGSGLSSFVDEERTRRWRGDDEEMARRWRGELSLSGG